MKQIIVVLLLTITPLFIFSQNKPSESINWLDLSKAEELANKHHMIPMSIHKKPPCSKSSRVRILARISKKSPVDKSAMGK